MSVFTDIDPSHWVASNDLAFALRDRYPVSPGHTLVITKREVPTWFEATLEEQRAVMALVDEVKRALDREFAPAGYNVGFNAGEAAGQTVMHLHVHVIPPASCGPIPSLPHADAGADALRMATLLHSTDILLPGAAGATRNL